MGLGGLLKLLMYPLSIIKVQKAAQRYGSMPKKDTNLRRWVATLLEWDYPAMLPPRSFPVPIRQSLKVPWYSLVESRQTTTIQCIYQQNRATKETFLPSSTMQPRKFSCLCHHIFIVNYRPIHRLTSSRPSFQQLTSLRANVVLRMNVWTIVRKIVARISRSVLLCI